MSQKRLFKFKLARSFKQLIIVLGNSLSLSLLNDECVKTHSFIHLGDEEKLRMKLHPLKLNTISLN